MGTFSSASSKLRAEITNSSIQMGNLFSKMMIGFFKLMNSSFSVMKSGLEVGTFSSASIELVGQVMHSGVEMGNLVCESRVG
jgi:hypothetical protein